MVNLTYIWHLKGIFVIGSYMIIAWMNSHADSMDEIPGCSLEIIEKNLTIKSKSNEVIDMFNIKTKEITESMVGLHFNTTDFRNK